MSKKKAKKSTGNIIAVNRRARHDFFIEDTFEAGLALEGWEAKSLREGRAQLTEAYVNLRGNEAWLIGAHFSPLKTTASHIKADPTRSRKLLLHRQEIDRLTGAVERKGFTLVPLDLHWHKGRAKLNIGLAKGKKQHDKRTADKDRDWQRQKERILKH
jgi:SsrA-binding protein